MTSGPREGPKLRYTALLRPWKERLPADWASLTQGHPCPAVAACSAEGLPASCSTCYRPLHTLGLGLLKQKKELVSKGSGEAAVVPASLLSVPCQSRGHSEYLAGLLRAS